MRPQTAGKVLGAFIVGMMGVILAAIFWYLGMKEVALFFIFLIPAAILFAVVGEGKF